MRLIWRTVSTRVHSPEWLLLWFSFLTVWTHSQHARRCGTVRVHDVIVHLRVHISSSLMFYMPTAHLLPAPLHSATAPEMPPRPPRTLYYNGALTVEATLTGNYVYYDAENDVQGASTFHWYTGTDSTCAEKPRLTAWHHRHTQLRPGMQANLFVSELRRLLFQGRVRVRRSYGLLMSL